MIKNDQTKECIKKNREVTLKTCKEAQKNAGIVKWFSLCVGVGSAILGTVTKKNEYLIGTALGCAGAVAAFGVEERCEGTIRTLENMADYFFEDDTLQEET